MQLTVLTLSFLIKTHLSQNGSHSNAYILLVLRRIEMMSQRLKLDQEVFQDQVVIVQY